MNEYSLTPVQEVDGLHIKRDDLYAPFGMMIFPKMSPI